MNGEVEFHAPNQMMARCVDGMIHLHDFRLVEEHPGTFGRVLSGRLDVKGKVWKVSMARRLGYYMPYVSLPGFFQAGKGDECTYLPDCKCDKLEHLEDGKCWLLLLGRFRGGDVLHRFQFLALKPAKDVKSAWGRVYRRIGMVVYMASSSVMDAGVLAVPGEQVSLSLV